MNSANGIYIFDFPEEDLASIVKWRNDPDVNKYLRPNYRTLEDVQEWYRGYFSSGGNRLFGIRAADELIGYCTIEAIEKANNKCEVGIAIGEKAYWRKGIGSAVIRQLLKIAFTDLQMHRVEAVVQGDNVASARCFSRAGFQLDGTLRDSKLRNCEYVDLLVYSILDTEWDGGTTKHLCRVG